MSLPGVPGVVGPEVSLPDDDDDDEHGVRKGYQPEGGGEDSSYKSTSASISRFGGSISEDDSSYVNSPQTRNSPPPSAHFEKMSSYPSYPSRNFAGPGGPGGPGAGSIRQRRSSSRLYPHYHGFVEEYDYDYDYLMPPRMGGMGEASIRDVDMDSDMPSPPPIRLATFPASQAPGLL
jgi:hypothetical protein